MSENGLKNDFYKVGDIVVISKDNTLKKGILKDIKRIKNKVQYFVEYLESNKKYYRWCTENEITKVFNCEVQTLDKAVIHTNIKEDDDIGAVATNLMKVFKDEEEAYLKIDREYPKFLFNSAIHINHLKGRIEELEKNLKQSDEYKNKIYKELDQEKTFNEYLINAIKRRVIGSEDR